MLRYGFEELGFNRISLEVFDFNKRALRAYRKFVAEGRLREVL
ncbi:MAG: GNAT family protein [Trueperaceae bacterium]